MSAAAWTALEGLSPELMADHGEAMDWRRRLKRLEQAVEAQVGDPITLALDRGAILARTLDEPVAAEQALTAMLETSAGARHTELRRAQLHVSRQQGDVHANTHAIEELMGLDVPGTADLLVEHGIRLQEAGHREASGESLREALARDPESALCWWRLAAVTEPEDRTSWLALLGHRLERLPQGPLKARLHMAIGGLQGPGQIATAIRHLEQAWLADPSAGLSREALQMLIQAGAGAEQGGEGLLSAFSEARSRAHAAEARAMLALLEARLDPQRAADPQLASALEGAAHTLAEVPWALEMLATIYEAQGAWSKGAQCLEALAERAEGPLEALLYYRAGLARERAGDHGATRIYERAVAADEECLPAWAALRRLAIRQDDFETLAESTEAMISRVDHPEVQGAWALSAAAVRRARLGTSGDAPIDDTLKLLVDTSSTPAAARATWALLGDVLRRRGTLGEIPRAALHTLAEYAEEDVACLARRRLAERLQWTEGRPEEATAWWRQVLDLRQADPEAMHALMLLSERAGDEESWLEWALAWGATSPTERDPARQAARLSQVGHRARRRGHLQRAEALWRQALALDPASLSARVGLGRLLNHLGRWHDLAAFHEEELASLPEGDLRTLPLLSQLANLYAYHLEEETLAAGAFEALLAAAPERFDAQLGLERIYDRQQRVEALQRVLEVRAAQSVNPVEQAVSWLTIAEQAWVHELSTDGIGPRLQAVTGFVDALPSGQWPLLRAAICADSGDATLLRALAALDPAAAHLAARNGAVLWSTVVDNWPRDLDAQWAELAHETPREAMHDRLNALAAEVESDEDRHVIRTVAAALSDGRSRTERSALWRGVLALEPEDEQAWGAIVSAAVQGVVPDDLGRLARHARDSEVKGVIFWLAGLWAEAQGDLPLASRHFSSAHRISPSDPVPPWLMLQTTGADERPPGARAALLEQMAQAFDDPQLAAEALTEAAHLWSTLVGDSTRALATYRRALKRNPKAEAAFEGALTLTAESGDPQTRADLLRVRATEVDDRERRRSMLQEAARIVLEELSDSAGARDILKTLLEYEPDDVQAWRRVANLARTLGDLNEALHCLERLTELTDSPETLAALHREMGHLLYTEAHEPWAAIEQFEQALELQSGDRETLLALAAIREQSGDPLGALSAWERLAVIDPVGTQGEVHQARHRLTSALVEPEALDILDTLQTRPLDIDYSPASEAVTDAMDALGVERTPAPATQLPQVTFEPLLTPAITEAPEMAALMHTAGLEVAESMTELSADLPVDPRTPAAWRSLIETHEIAQDDVAVHWMSSVLAWIEGAEAPDKLRCARATRLLPEVLRERALPDAIPRPLGRMLRLLSTEIGNFFLSGVGEIAAHPVEDPTWGGAVRHWAQALRPPPVLALVSPALSGDLHLQGHAPVALMVSEAHLESESEGALDALAVAALIPVVEGLRPAFTLDDATFEAWLSVVLDQIDAQAASERAPVEIGAGIPGMHPHTIDTRLINRREELIQVAQTTRRLMHGRGGALIRRGLQDYHRRLVLALSHDVMWALSWLTTDPDVSAEEEARRTEDLLRFAASPHCLAIRRWLSAAE
ncbi:MAG: hypothetical protein ACE366_19715 [Bradymonadia bacterium]